MPHYIIIPKQIITVNSKDEILLNHIIEIKNDKIISIRKYNADELKLSEAEIIKAENLTLSPGFVQTHIHLCQTLFRGLADDLELLDWLQLRIFPFENAHNKNSLKTSTQIGINELLKGGTTTILDMGTLRYQEIIFEELISSGMRATAGKCMMDINDLFPSFLETTDKELKNTYELASSFHNKEKGRIKYGFAPRFVLSCSEKLLKETKEMMKDFSGSIYHTHSSENKNELEEVRKKFNKDNLEYFESIGVLDEYSVLAHCIHINENEIQLLKKNNSKVSHCPSSNLKLGSGIANIPRYLKEGINVSLGADGAPCNNHLSIFNEMKLASLIQKPIYGPKTLNAKTIFKLATIEGAKALHLDNEIGSIEVGKKADIVLLDLEKPTLSLWDENEHIYSNIVYAASSENVHSVMIDGKWIIRNNKSLIYNEKELFNNGKIELKKLLNRI
ncbi:MAG: 5'-deoxyadenosine deaminase [Ignavibacterium sp.]